MPRIKAGKNDLISETRIKENIEAGVAARTIAYDKIKPPATIEAGVKTLLQQLNNNYFGIWDFELTVDPYDSTNIQIIDKSISVETSGKGVPYTKFSENGKQSEPGIYKFPSYRLGSMVKNQTLSFKIPSGMAVTAMYGSNTPKTPVDDASHVDSQINTQFALDDDVPGTYDDAYLFDIESTHRAWGVDENGTPLGNKIGSKDSSVNSKITKTSGNLIIRGEGAPWVSMTIAEQLIENPDKPGVTEKIVAKKAFADAKWHYDAGHGLIDLRKYTTDLAEGPTLGGTALNDIAIGDILEGKTDTGYYVLDPVAKSYVLAPIVEPIVSKVIKGTIDIEGRKDFYRQDFIIPAELGLEIDGIEGLIPGNLIHTDYIPSKYNKNVEIDGNDYGPFTYFQIFKLTHKISPSGWTTEIGTKMRVNTELLHEKSADITAALSSGTLRKSINTQPTNNNTLSVARDNVAKKQIADAESIDRSIDSTQNVASVEPDDFTDTELLTGAVDAEYWEAQAEETSTIATGNASLYEAIQAKNKGVNTQPPPLTGEGNDGNKVVSIETGPAGEEIKSNSKGQFYYVDSDGNAVIVKAKVNQKGEAIIVQQDPNPDEGLVLISDIFKYNLAGEATVLIAEEDPVDEIPEEVLDASLDNIPDGLSMEAGALLVIQQKMKKRAGIN